MKKERSATYEILTEGVQRSQKDEGYGAIVPCGMRRWNGCVMQSCKDWDECCFPVNCDRPKN
jgi:hypothetical protein